MNDSQDDENSGDDSFSLIQPFIIDGEGYTDRDREMFVAGYEFAEVMSAILRHRGEFACWPVHVENEDRIRAACVRHRVPYELRQENETWMTLEIFGEGQN